MQRQPGIGWIERLILKRLLKRLEKAVDRPFDKVSSRKIDALNVILGK
jgi:hypothetical protein